MNIWTVSPYDYKSKEGWLHNFFCFYHYYQLLGLLIFKITWLFYTVVRQVTFCKLYGQGASFYQTFIFTAGGKNKCIDFTAGELAQTLHYNYLNSELISIYNNSCLFVCLFVCLSVTLCLCPHSPPSPHHGYATFFTNPMVMSRFLLIL